MVVVVVVGVGGGGDEVRGWVFLGGRDEIIAF